jgi:hypothetical protein
VGSATAGGQRVRTSEGRQATPETDMPAAQESWKLRPMRLRGGALVLVRCAVGTGR